MNYGDYLFDQEESEKSLVDKLLLMDSALMQVHMRDEFVASNLLEAIIVNDQIIGSSMEFDKFDPEKNEKSKDQDILEFAAIALCAVNRFGEYEGFPHYYTSPEFIAHLMDQNNVETYLRKETIPEELKDYFRSIFTTLDIKYLGTFLEDKKNGGKGNTMQLVYSTPEGRAFAKEQENSNPGFASIIAIPAVLAIVYIISMAIIIAVKVLK